MSTFLSDDQTLSDLAATIKATGVEVIPGYWPAINTRAHTRAYNEIYSALIGRGYSASQIAAWDRGEEFESDLTVWFAISKSSSATPLNQKVFSIFDRRADLQAVPIVNAGVLQAPAEGSQGTIHTGAPATDTDVFVWPPTDGSTPSPADELGQPTRW